MQNCRFAGNMDRISTKLKTWAFFFAGALLFTGQILGQGAIPLGPEFGVETSAASARFAPAVAYGSDGRFLVVWESDVNSISTNIRGRFFGADGTPVGNDFIIDTFAGMKSWPAVATLPNGDYIVTWEALLASPPVGSDTSGTSIRARLYHVGNFGTEFQVNTVTNLNQILPDVASAPNGDFVIVWESDTSSGNDSDGTSIEGQRFSASGNRLGSEFQVNSFVSSSQGHPRVAMAQSGFVVGWTNSASPTDSDQSIRARRFDSNGTASGSDFQVNVFTSGPQSVARIAMGSAGDFFVVWQSGSIAVTGPDNGYSSVQGRRYASDGTPLGGEFTINTQTADAQGEPVIARDTHGRFVVVWWDRLEVGDGGIRGQRFDQNGNRIGTEFHINTFTPNAQDTPSVAFSPSGDFVVAWRSFNQSGDGTSNMIGRRFSGTPDLTLALNFFTLAPCRAVDTRQTTPLSSGVARTFSITGVCGVPSTAKAVSANVTAISPTGSGFLTLWPTDLSMPLVSTINFSTSSVRSNNALVTLATDGSGQVKVGAAVTSNGTVHLVLDVTGYFQ